jgi:uncharacterized protein (TIGR02145 family)
MINQYGLILFLFFYTIGFAQRPCPGIATVKYAGKTYHTVQIGNQCWLKENINVGTRINGSEEQTNNGIIEKYCYDDNEENCSKYGGLYLWNEAMQYNTLSKTEGICPQGWHLPSKEEFDTLSSKSHNDGNNLKAIGNGSSAGAGNNKSGFAALMSGYRKNSGEFFGLSSFSEFWSSTKVSSSKGIGVALHNNDNSINMGPSISEGGFSVRCIKDKK